MAHLTASVEYAIHCLLWLIDAGSKPLSSRDLAELQGISPSFVAKLFPKLEKAGIVTASEGVRGGYVLARPPEEITFLQVIDAIEGFKPLFECQEIRDRIALFGDTPPAWATDGLCAIHVVMIKAEKAMRAQLAAHSLADVAFAVTQKAPTGFKIKVLEWMDERVGGRRPGRPAKKRTASS
ncbi:Transcriptional regulator, BadM/Rrf2 family [Azoarcus sp. CIB]|uniref:RrF2 family transcriptional regulator n=1 Tax=Aromatoleum sp. (strain CIB) TaxID=198107 RepID=UPI00067B0D8B|nr:Rrf2 family transcriptional regulator [Azoarcus sp. CIB]AKU11316.1 Transcriptional regulator, BadM/Rrf2 family [Azoarcus sp. CIB]